MPAAPAIAVALGVIVLALTAVLFLFASKQFIDTQIAFVRGMPVVGPWTAAHLDQVVTQVQQQMLAWARTASQPLVDALDRWTSRMRGHQQASQAAHAASAAVHRDTRQVLLPAARQAAQDYADAQDQALEARDLGRAREQRLATEQAGFSAQQYADQVGARVRAYATALALRDRALEQADLAALQTATAQLVGQAMRRADDQLAQARADAAEQEAVTRALMMALVGTAQQQAQDLVAGLGGVVTGISQQDRLYAQQQAALVGAGATAAIAVVAGAVEAINRSPCMQRCQTLGGLGAALEAIDLGLVLVLLAEAGRDPHGTAELVQRVTAGPLAFARDTFAAATGAH